MANLSCKLEVLGLGRDPIDFVALSRGALAASVCRSAIALFERSEKKRGIVGDGSCVPALKDSWDIAITGRPEWTDIEGAINQCVLKSLVSYVRHFPQFILAPQRLQKLGSDGTPGHLVGPADLRDLPDSELAAVIAKIYRPSRVCVQKYLSDEGGYPYWHSEVFPSANGEAFRRVLFFLVYLNDGFEAGETEFQEQGLVVNPCKGAVLIAPAGFTHAHRGNRPRKGDKYVATGWILFRE